LKGEDNLKFVLSLEDGTVMSKECKTKDCHNKLQQLQWTEQGKEEDHAKDGELGLGGLKSNGNKKQAGNSQRLSGMEDTCIGSQGPQHTVVLEEEEEVEEGEEEEI
jgi:hypothetical protein